METPDLAEGKAAVLVPEHEKLANDKMIDKHGSSIAGSSNTSIPVAESPKVSVLASKSGMNFVIPRNKIFGAIVPVTKPSKWEPCEPKKEDPTQPSRKTKWGADLTQDAVVKRGRALALQTRAEQIAAQLESGNLDIDNNDGTRSPSPPPIYDQLGHRMNTREGRKREQLDLERREAIGECLKLNPSYKPPSGYKSVPKEAKLFIPAKDHPGYNFIGLILGPRGNTQKRMEAETGTKITIRGKGAVKEGKLQAFRRDGKEVDGAFEDLHVHITADTYEKVDAAVAIIEPLLTPISEDRNTHKIKQLRELAEMNGTVRDFTRACTICGDVGHREWQCPKDKLTTFQAKVMCRFCGDGGHPSIDCPLKRSGQGKVLDKEYLNFLEELGSGLGGIDTPTDSDVHPPGFETNSVTRPMLLTASGALPMPSRWMFSASGSEAMTDFAPRAAADGASDIGGFPRFPFPIPPFGRTGRGGFNFFLPPFFHPGLIAAFFGGRPPPFPGQGGFPPRMPLDPRAMLSFFRGRFPFPPFGLRPDMRPPTSSNTPDNQQSTGEDQRAQASDLVEGGGTQVNPEMYGELQATDVTLNTSQSQDASIVESAKPSLATSPMSSDAASSYASAMAPSYLSVPVPPSSSATASTMSTFPFIPTFPSMTPPSSLPPAAPVLPHSVLLPSPPPPAPPLAPALPAASSSFTLPVSPVRGIMPSVRPALPSIRPAVPPIAPVVPSLAHTASTSGSNILPSVLQTPCFSTVGNLGQASSDACSSVEGTANVISSSISSNVPRPPQPWTDITVAAQPSWPQGQHSHAPTSPQQSSQVFTWQHQISRYPSQAVHEPLPSQSMGYPPPPLPFSTQSNQVGSMSVPTHLAPAASNNFSFVRPQGTAHFLSPPLPPVSGPNHLTQSPLLASQVQSSTQNSPGSVQPLFSSFTPVHPRPSHDHFGLSLLPPSNNPHIQAALVPLNPPPHSSGFSNTRFLPPPLPGPQIRLGSASNLSPQVPMGDHRPVFSFNQSMPVPLHSFSFQPQEAPTARSQVAYVSEKSASFQTPEFSTVRPWQPYAQASMSPSPSSITAAMKSPLFYPQEVLDKGNTYDYNPRVSMSPHSVYPVLHQQSGMSRTPSTSFDQNVSVTSNFLGVTGINPLSSIRPGVQQAWVQPQTGRTQNWAESHHGTGISETEEVDPEYEKLMESVGVI